LHIHDSLSTERNFLDILLYKLGEDKLFPGFASLCPHNHPGKDNWNLVGILHSRIILGDHNIAHVYRLLNQQIKTDVIKPQIFKGASNSKRIGYSMKISFVNMQRALISFSRRSTFFPGF